MEIHKPKAAHSFREFLIEIGTIICGILIALTLEQAIESLHWRHKAEEAEQSMRLELKRDDGPQAYARVAITGCLNNQLDAIIQAVEAGRDGRDIVRLADAYEPPLRTWDHQSWDATVSADVGSHIGSEQLSRWSRIFDLATMLNAQAAREVSGLDLLTGGPGSKGALSPEQADRMIRAAKLLKRANYEIGGVARLMLKWSKPVDAEPSAQATADILAEGRARYGSCVVVPQPDDPRGRSSEFNNGRQMLAPGSSTDVH